MKGEAVPYEDPINKDLSKFCNALNCPLLIDREVGLMAYCEKHAKERTPRAEPERTAEVDLERAHVFLVDLAQRLRESYNSDDLKIYYERCEGFLAGQGVAVPKKDSKR